MDESSSKIDSHGRTTTTTLSPGEIAPQRTRSVRTRAVVTHLLDHPFRPRGSPLPPPELGSDDPGIADSVSLRSGNLQGRTGSSSMLHPLGTRTNPRRLPRSRREVCPGSAPLSTTPTRSPPMHLQSCQDVSGRDRVRDETSPLWVGRVGTKTPHWCLFVSNSGVSPGGCGGTLSLSLNPPDRWVGLDGSTRGSGSGPGTGARRVVTENLVVPPPVSSGRTTAASHGA